MKLTIKVVEDNGQAPIGKLEYDVEQLPIFLGRAEDCNIVLPDETKYVSGMHAYFTHENDQLFVHDLSTNGVFVNGSTERLRKGNRQLVQHGDHLLIGDFRLKCLTGNNDKEEVEPPQGVQSTAAGGIQRLESAPGSADGVTTKLQDSEDPILKDFPDLPTDWPDDSPPDAPEPEGEKSPSAVGVESDWPEDWPKGNGRADIDAPKATTSNESDPGPQTANRELLEIFLHTLNLDEELSIDLSDQILVARVAYLLKHSVEGIRQLLAARQDIKHSFKADLTRIGSEANNPLKISPDLHSTWRILLAEEKNPSYMSAERAITEAVQDLKIHQLATLDGMKAAVQSILTQFDPEHLQTRLEKSSPLAASIPITRETKLWDLFTEHYSEINTQAVQDFDKLFSEEFRRAYERRAEESGDSDW